MNLSEALANKIIEKLSFRVKLLNWHSFNIFKENILIELYEDGGLTVKKIKKLEGFDVYMKIEIGNFKNKMDIGYDDNDPYILDLYSKIEHSIQVIKEC